MTGLIDNGLNVMENIHNNKQTDFIKFLLGIMVSYLTRAPWDLLDQI